jgi:hypothetical protein
LALAVTIAVTGPPGWAVSDAGLIGGAIPKSAAAEPNLLARVDGTLNCHGESKNLRSHERRGRTFSPSLVVPMQLASLSGSDILARTSCQLTTLRRFWPRYPHSSIGTLVTHEDDPARVADLISVVRPSVVQIHSEVPPSDCAALKRQFERIRIIKSYHVTGPEALDYGYAYVDVVDAFHLDSKNLATGQVGGTGLLHDWNLSATIVQRYRLPVVLAGGLTRQTLRRR